LDYSNVVDRAKRKGIKIIGYVDTNYGGCDIERIEQEISFYKNWYKVDGIFLDQVSCEISKTNYYREIQGFIKSRPGLLTVLNPGTFPDESLMNIGDIICVYDGSANDYIIRNIPEWIFNYPPSRFWHIIYAATTVEEMRRVLKKSYTLNAGHIYITDENTPNPFCSLPSYWDSETIEV
jgi:hypothetical protein